jgi:hypothetical protein
LFIHCAKGTIELTSSNGERFEVGIAATTTIRLATFLVDEKFVGGNIRAVRDFSVVFEREMCPWAISKYFGDLVSNTSA